MTHVESQKDNEEKKVKQYYHNKHLGSEQFVTDWKGRQYEHIEYTPYGELWIEETAPGVDKLPFRFTARQEHEKIYCHTDLGKSNNFPIFCIIS